VSTSRRSSLPPPVPDAAVDGPRVSPREVTRRELLRLRAELAASPDDLGLLRRACALLVAGARGQEPSDDAVHLDLWRRLTLQVPDHWEAWRWRAFYLGEHPGYHALLADRERLFGFEVDDRFRALADRVFERFAHLWAED